MKKLLNIALLCFSVNANAEQYLCIGEKASFLTASGNDDLYESLDTRLLIDLNQGYKIIGVQELDEFEGTCEKSAREEAFFECSGDRGFWFEKIIAYGSPENFLYFTYVRQMGQMVNARRGTCTLI
jgi:hypothetical protein